MNTNIYITHTVRYVKVRLDIWFTLGLDTFVQIGIDKLTLLLKSFSISITQHTAQRCLRAGFLVGAICVVFGLGVGVVVLGFFSAGGRV